MTSSTMKCEKAAGRDAALVARAKAGDAPAIDQLVRKYWPDAYRTATRILRSHADAEEAAQDALCLAVSNLSSFREDASLGTWIHRIAVNRSLVALRRNRGRAGGASPVPLEPVEPFLSGGPTPEQVLLETERLTAVEEGLEHLPKHYLSILQLFVFDGRSTNEIAASLGLSPNAVKTRLHRGRNRLLQEVRRRFFPSVTDPGVVDQRTRQHHPAPPPPCVA